eukprot:12009504-Alexandrium_andersonii.AAC.1
MSCPSLPRIGRLRSMALRCRWCPGASQCSSRPNFDGSGWLAGASSTSRSTRGLSPPQAVPRAALQRCCSKRWAAAPGAAGA